MGGFVNEPITSFSSAANREKFAGALRYVRGEFGLEYPLVIDGKAVKTGAWRESFNPSKRSEVVGRVAVATEADADHAIAAARRALGGWRRTRVPERAEKLRNAAETMRKRRFELAAWVTFEAGKPWREADADVAEAIDYLEYYAAGVEGMALRPRRRDLPGEENTLTHEPKGVCVVLGTWSFPLALLSNMTAAALATGNTVVMKPASATTVVGAKFAEILNEAGLEPGVLNYLPGAGAVVGKHLAASPEVNVVAFTGSRDVGTEILRMAPMAPVTQQHIKRVIAELGGKNAIIVDDDADLGEAVGGVVKSAFGYSGQKCTACSRAVVLESVYEEFCGKLAEATESLMIGPADDPGTYVGPVIDGESRARIMRYVEIGRGEGRVLVDRSEDGPAGDGYFVGPIIFTDVDAAAAIAQEEIFGPVLAVIRARDFDDALAIANGTRYALTGGVYSRSPAHIEQAKREFLVGNLYINRKITGSRVDIEPFGGLKMSGDGAKAGGPEYLHWYCDARTITEHTLRHGLAPAQEVQTRV